MNWLIYVPNPTVAAIRFKELGLIGVRDNGDGPFDVAIEGVDITEIPDVVLGDGSNSPHRHFNIRITPHALTEITETIDGEEVTHTVRLDVVLATFMEDAIAANKPAQSNKNEKGWKYRGIVIIEANSIATKRHMVL